MQKSCSYCLGKKKIVGLGMIMKTCPTCSGLGFVKEDSLPLPTQNLSLEAEKKPRRKRQNESVALTAE